MGVFSSKEKEKESQESIMFNIMFDFIMMSKCYGKKAKEAEAKQKYYKKEAKIVIKF